MKRVLVVDDMAIFREPIAAILRREGYDAACASNGQEVLLAVRDQRPDLILLDISMPLLDGMACLRLLRGHSATKDIPVIMLTAVSDRDTVLEAGKAGAQGYLLKSQFSCTELMGRVKKLIGEPVDPAAGGEAATPSPSNGSDSGAPTITKRDPQFVHAAIRRRLELHPVPPVLHHVISLTRNSRSSIDDLALAIRNDLALSLRVMKIANSSIYGAGRKAQNLSEAAQRIGLIGIRNAVAAIAAVDNFGEMSIDGLVPQRFWEHSVVTGVAAQAIGEVLKIEHAEELFLAGLLHDVGRMTLAVTFPDDYFRVLRAWTYGGEKLAWIERAAFSMSHDEVTREVLGQWEMSPMLIDAAWLHEHPVSQINRLAREPRDALVVSLANRIAHALLIGDSGNPVIDDYQEHVEALALTSQQLRELVADITVKSRDTTVFYAAHAEERFRRPMAEELAGAEQPTPRVKVIAEQAPADPMSLMIEQLGWNGGDRANVGVLYASESKQMPKLFHQLKAHEERSGNTLSLVLVTPPLDSGRRTESAVLPWADLIQARKATLVHTPARYSEIVTAMRRAATDVGPARQPTSSAV